VRTFHSAYIHSYFRLRANGEDEYSRWLPIIAVARLSERISDEEKWLIAMAEKEFGE